MRVFNPFGPALAKVKIPKKIVNKINLEVDKIIFNKKLSNKNDYFDGSLCKYKSQILSKWVDFTSN